MQSADAGYRFKLSISVKNSLGTTTLLSALSTAVGGAPPAPAPPANTSLPTISGTPTAGQTLQGRPAPGRTARRATPASGSAATPREPTAQLSSAPPSPSYLLASADVGSTIRVRVTATNAVGSASAQSAQTAVIGAAPPAASSASSPATPAAASSPTATAAAAGPDQDLHGHAHEEHGFAVLPALDRRRPGQRDADLLEVGDDDAGAPATPPTQ